MEPELPPSPASTAASPGAEAPEAADLETAVVVSAIATDSGSPTRLYAGTSRGLRRSPDSGQSWVAVEGSIAEYFISAVVVDPALPSVVYASTDGAGIFQSTDAGVSWTEVNRGLANLSVGALAFAESTSGTTLFAGTDERPLPLGQPGFRLDRPLPGPEVDGCHGARRGRRR